MTALVSPALTATPIGSPPSPYYMVRETADVVTLVDGPSPATKRIEE